MIDFNDKQREIIAIILLFLAMVALIIAMSACNVTRTVTTTAQTVQRGDTTVTIMTRTVESYDGKVDAGAFSPLVR